MLHLPVGGVSVFVKLKAEGIQAVVVGLSVIAGHEIPVVVALCHCLRTDKFLCRCCSTNSSHSFVYKRACAGIILCTMQVVYLARTENHLIVILVNSKNLCMCREACRDAERIALVFLLFEFEIHMFCIFYRCAVASRIKFFTFIIWREEIAHEIVTRCDICCRQYNRPTASSCGNFLFFYPYAVRRAFRDIHINREIFIFARRIAYFPGIAASITAASYRIRGGILCSFLVYRKRSIIDCRLHLITQP